MNQFFKKHAAGLKSTALVLMLLIPFLLYTAVLQGSPFMVNMFLGIFIANMLFVMKFG